MSRGYRKTSKILLCFFFLSMLTACTFHKTLEVPDDDSASIADLNISKQEISYPDDWPVDLRLPNNFILVEANSGVSVGGSQQGWTAMYRFSGNIDEAEEAINQYFTQNGWDIVVSEKQEVGGYMLLVQNENTEGFTVIEVDQDNSRKSLIMVTFSR